MSTMLCDHRRKCLRTACRSCAAAAAGHVPHPTAWRRCNCIVYAPRASATQHTRKRDCGLMSNRRRARANGYATTTAAAADHTATATATATVRAHGGRSRITKHRAAAVIRRRTSCVCMRVYFDARVCVCLVYDGRVYNNVHVCMFLHEYM